MRLQRLDLTRYGRFTEYSIDFGETTPGTADLHIVYGANEAGKSTALAAFLDLLYGIEPRSRFDFLHPYAVMRIGAALAFAGNTHELVRVKRAQNSLLDGNGLPIGETVLAGQLGGIDRDSYRAMFSLDDETLEAGGESILASKGDLGQLLFSASTGLADLSRTLVDLRGEADGFYRYHAHAGELTNLKLRLAALKEDRERLDTAATRYAQLIDIRDHALRQYDDAIATRAAMQARIDDIQRRINALPRLAALRAARERLQPLADLPTPPAQWHAALPALQSDDIALSVRTETIAHDIARKSAEHAAIAVDETALSLADKVARLDDLRARYVTADKDVPERRLQVRAEDLTIAGILARIGRAGDSGPRRLVLGAATVGVLQDLIGQRSGIEAAHQAAANELLEARRRCEEAEARLQQADADTGTAPGSAARIAVLAAAVAALHADDHAARRRIAERSRAAGVEELADRLLALRPWQGDGEQLAALAVPEPGEMQRWKTALAAAQTQYDRCAAELERLTTERLRLTAERDAIAAVAGVVSEHESGRIRAGREAAWAEHRHRLDADSADAFEVALRHDDIVMDARLRHEADIARLQQTGQALAQAAAAADRAQEVFTLAAARLDAIQAEIAGAVTAILPGDATLARFEAWIERRDRTLDTRTRLKQAERDLREAAADAEAMRNRLRTALDAAGVRHDADAAVDALRARAQLVLDRAAELKALIRDAADRRRAVTQRERNFAAAAERDQAWCAAWADACASCWLAESGAPPSLAAAREILAAMADLGPALDRRASLAERIERMLEDQQAFAAALAAIARTLGVAADTDAPLDLAHTVTSRVQAAQAARTARAARLRELEAARALQAALAETRAIHDGRKVEMTTFFAVGSLAALAGKLAGVERKAALEAQAEEATREICDALRLPSIDDAATVLDNADRAALDAELAGLKARFDDQDQRTRELFSAHSKAVDQVDAVGGDAAVARIEEQRRTLLLEIEDGALRYLRLRVGIVAAEHALRAYRAQHRSSMMAQASEAFRTISRDAYSGLASQPNKDSEILIAVAADGSSKLASELSKGTRFQLYLALRVAGYHEFAKLRPPVPFIADDIMETFDDFRAEEALRLLTTMAAVGQVIYLTHHRHLCDIARRICPGVAVHELSPVAA